MYKWNPKVKVGDYEFYKQYINKTNNLKRKFEQRIQSSLEYFTFIGVVLYTLG